MKAPYLKVENNQTIFIGKYMEVYIPKYYYDRKMVSTDGTSFKVFGIFTFKIFNTDNLEEVGKLRDKTKLQSFNLPATIETIPSDTFNKKMDLLNTGNEDDIEEFVVYQYYEEDIFINNNDIVLELSDLMNTIEIINGGKVPSTIPYDKILTLEYNGFAFNGRSVPVPSTVLEVMISEVCRNPKDLSKPYRNYLNKLDKPDYYSHKMVNIRKLAELNSTFTGITFEDFNTAVIYGINKQLRNSKENISPMEEIIKY